MGHRRTNRAGPHYARAVANIERAMGLSGMEGVSQKEIALTIGISESSYTQKLRGIRAHFYEDELQAIADFIRQRTKRPLTGFPHMEWQMMEAIDRKVCGWRP